MPTGARVTSATISENLFEALCGTRGIRCERVPVGKGKTPDYEIVLGFQRLAVEVKQLDSNGKDERINQVLDAGADFDGVVSPAQRVRDQIARGYRQLKAAAREGQPCLLVIYNNAGFLNFIDSFAVTTAMFGTYGVRLALTPQDEIRVVGQHFMGNRRVTRNSCKQLSAVGVLKDARSGSLRLEVYHNPFALVPVDSSVMALLASSQFRHPNPHDGAFVPWEPAEIGA